MQSSGRVTKSKSKKMHWDEELLASKKAKTKLQERSALDVKRELEDYFEKKRIHELTKDGWH